MTSPLIYNIGTVTLTNGSAEVTGDGTAWAINGVVGGVFSCAGMSVPIVSVDDDETLTLAYPWPGSNASDVAYAISLISSQAADTIWANRHWSRVVGQALLAALRPDASGTLAERNALNPMLENGQWFARAEPPHDLEFYRKVPAGWEGPYLTRGIGGVGEGGLGLPSPGAANKAPYYSAADTISLYDQTAFGRALAALTGANGSIPVATGAGTAAMRAIVGTVSQSGGVPTGALMETGSNANGMYARWANGWQVCIGNRTLAQSMGTAYLGGFRGQGLHRITLPAAYINAASYEVALVAGGPNEGGVFGWLENRANRAPNSFQPLPLAVTSQSEAARYLQFVTAGRWF